jgi:parallel beta-helix repeat protein
MNRKLVFVLSLCVLLSLFLCTISRSVKVQASKGYPVHNFDTGLTYETIQEAIDAPETLDGHTVIVDAGEFHENVVINKTISLLGENRDSTTIDGKGVGTVISIEASNVTVREFTVQNSGTDSPDSGISIRWESHVQVEDNNIKKCHNGISAIFSGGQHLIRNNKVTECTGDAIYLGGYDNIVEGNTVTKSNHSVSLFFSRGNMIRGNSISDNSRGIYLCASSENTIARNNIINNTAYGIFLVEFSSNNTIFENTVAGNSYGVEAINSGENKLHHNRFVENHNQAYLSGYGVESNLWHDQHSSEGNYWSDYGGVDSDGDGIGEDPYYISHFYGYKDDYPLVLVLVDQAITSHETRDLNSRVTVAFQVKLHPHNRTNAPANWLLLDTVVGAIVYVNGTRYATNATGWISFEANYNTAGKRVWVLKNCYQVVENPSTEWIASWIINIWSVLTQWGFWIIIGIVIGTVLTVNRIRPKPLRTHLENGEFVIREFHGGRGIANEEKKGLFRQGTISLGRWYVTNRRLIYEGKIEYPEVKRAIIFPLWTKKEPDIHSYTLNEMKNIEITDKGIWHGKYVEATFKSDKENRHVQILTRKKEEFVKAVQQASA